MLKKNAAINSSRYAILTLGVLVCLVGALLMFDGSILGERTADIATVVGITGIGIITLANKRIKR